jgi:branched-chain amino acid transport system permease protein
MTGRYSLLGGVVPPALYVAVVALVAWLATTGDQVLERVAIVAVLNLALVVALYVFTGLSGVFSFSHAAFAAVGAYTTAIFVVPVDQKEFIYPSLLPALDGLQASPVVATLLGGVAAAVAAAVAGIPLMRLVGLAAALGTFALLVIVRVTAAGWDAVTAGNGGVSGIPVHTNLVGALAAAAFTVVVAWLFQRSRWGLALRASREDEVAARSVGIGVVRERWVAFVLSGFLAGIAGGVYAQFLSTLTPDVFYLSLSFLTLAMLVVGGTESLAGAVLGTIVISVVSETFRRLEEGASFAGLDIPGRPGLREVGLALIMLVILLVRPHGLSGGKEVSIRPASRRRGTDPKERNAR